MSHENAINPEDLAPRPLGVSFNQDELRVLEWFRAQYWDEKNPKEPDAQAIAYMLLRVALGHREELATWIDEMLHYRELEGVSLSDYIDRRIAGAK